MQPSQSLAPREGLTTIVPGTLTASLVPGVSTLTASGVSFWDSVSRVTLTGAPTV